MKNWNFAFYFFHFCWFFFTFFSFFQFFSVFFTCFESSGLLRSRFFDFLGSFFENEKTRKIWVFFWNFGLKKWVFWLRSKPLHFNFEFSGFWAKFWRFKKSVFRRSQQATPFLFFKNGFLGFFLKICVFAIFSVFLTFFLDFRHFFDLRIEKVKEKNFIFFKNEKKLKSWFFPGFFTFFQKVKKWIHFFSLFFGKFGCIRKHHCF